MEFNWSKNNLEKLKQDYINLKKRKQISKQRKNKSGIKNDL